MAFGISAKHTKDISLGNLTIEQFTVIAIEAARKNDWTVGSINENIVKAYTDFSLTSYGEEITITIENDTVNLKSQCSTAQMVDWGKNKKNIELLVATIDELKNQYSDEELDEKYEELKPDLVPDENIIKPTPSSVRDNITNIFAIFIPTEGYFITPIIINLNILIYVLMVLSGVDYFLPDNESLLKWGANFKPITLEGQPWRLITSCFIHIGIFHLLMNMYALLYVGILLEPYLGKARFLAAYLLAGLCASLASLWWNDLIISAGASGAIFGMYGVFLAMLSTNIIEKSERKSLLTSIAIFVGYNLLNGLKSNSGIDNAAHYGGLVSGLIIGYALIPSLKNPYDKRLKFKIIGFLIILILAISYFVVKKTPNDIGIYDAKIHKFTSMEDNALEVYDYPDGTSKDSFLYAIKDIGIYNWKESIKLIESFKTLDLPIEIRTKNKLLKEYCELRISCYELLYKAIIEDTDQYQAQIEDYNNQIDSKIKELGGGQ